MNAQSDVFPKSRTKALKEATNSHFLIHILTEGKKLYLQTQAGGPTAKIRCGNCFWMP